MAKFKIRVYQIINDVDNWIYIGSTKGTINKRFSKHKSDAKGGSELKVHKHMRKIGFVHFSIEKICSCYVKNRLEKQEKEQDEIDNLEDDVQLLNTHRARKDPDYHKNYYRIYNQSEKRKQYTKDRWQETKNDPVKLKKEQERKRIVQQKYYEKNREERIQKQKEYYEKRRQDPKKLEQERAWRREYQRKYRLKQKN